MSVDDNERPSKGGGKYRSWQLICLGCLHDAINTAPFSSPEDAMDQAS
jgi:hypothetical protein